MASAAITHLNATQQRVSHVIPILNNACKFNKKRNELTFFKLKLISAKYLDAQQLITGTLILAVWKILLNYKK